MSTSPPTIVWFRRDLRLADNPALAAAVERGAPIVPLFIWAPDEEAPWQPGAASRWWLHHSLQSLIRGLVGCGSGLVVRTGPTLATLRSLIQETGARVVLWNRLYEPAITERDARVKNELRSLGVEAHSYNSSLLSEPGAIQTRLETPYTVFTPYWKTCLEQPEPDKPIPPPDLLLAPAHRPGSTSLESLGLLPRVDWAGGLAEAWTPGEPGAHAALARFTEESILHYGEDRDYPALPKTSRLSPHLHFGEIGPRQVWHAVKGGTPEVAKGSGGFLREIGWREFAHHLLFHYPNTTEKPLRQQFEGFPWKHDEKVIACWKRGNTGYPIVDAGMRELWHTGWMHNRVRMVVASLLVKHLLTHWSHGARWFWDTLVDANLANNTLGWQWTAGCGADAAPYFRIFNPVLQGEKFDKEGDYVRHWVPELSRMPSNWLHKPFEAPRAIIESSSVELGTTYPFPVVDQKYGRDRALAAYDFIKRGDSTGA